jgi:hypothetical protein
MSPQRARMIDDMILAGLAEGTRKLYVQAVRRLAAHYRCSRAKLAGIRQNRRTQMSDFIHSGFMGPNLVT